MGTKRCEQGTEEMSDHTRHRIGLSNYSNQFSGFVPSLRHTYFAVSHTYIENEQSHVALKKKKKKKGKNSFPHFRAFSHVLLFER